MRSRGQEDTATAKSLQSCLTLCDPINSSPPGSPIPGILQARTLQWVAISFQCMKVKSENEVAQSCPTPNDPMDCSLPGSSVHGICQARILEWGVLIKLVTIFKTDFKPEQCFRPPASGNCHAIG